MEASGNPWKFLFGGLLLCLLTPSRGLKLLGPDRLQTFEESLTPTFPGVFGGELVEKLLHLFSYGLAGPLSTSM